MSLATILIIILILHSARRNTGVGPQPGLGLWSFRDRGSDLSRNLDIGIVGQDLARCGY